MKTRKKVQAPHLGYCSKSFCGLCGYSLKPVRARKFLEKLMQENYNRKLLRLYQLMVNKKDNGQKLWDFVRLHPIKMFAKAKKDLKDKI